MKDNKYVRIWSHLYEDTQGNYSNRLKWSLFNRKNKFVDAFDYNIDQHKIRFYGSNKEYNLDDIPKYKKKLWDNYFDVFRTVEH